MIDYVNEFFKTAQRPVASRLICGDGTTMSVQASSGHHCTPKSDTGPWTHVEVFGVEHDGRKIRPRSFGGDHDEPYPLVSVGTVNAFIKRHKGLAV